MVAYGAPTYSEANATQSVVVEAKAQDMVVLMYDALKSNNVDAAKKVEAQIGEYVASLSKEDQIRFCNAFEKAYGELIATGKITKVEPTTATTDPSLIDTAIQTVEGWVATGTEKVKDVANQAANVYGEAEAAVAAAVAAAEAAVKALGIF
jgi:triphosphoribosyl-dephospho-CoA synthetase